MGLGCSCGGKPHAQGGVTPHLAWCHEPRAGSLDAGHDLKSHRLYGAHALAALVPSTAYDAGYLYRVVDTQPRPWATVLEWAPEIKRWLPYAAGVASCVDALVRALSREPVADQTRVGLPWVESLVVSDPAAIAYRSWLLPQWLRDIRGDARNKAIESWQRIVDALAVAGDSRVSDLMD